MATKTKSLLQDEFSRLSARRDEILAQSTPLREQRDADFNVALALRRERDFQIKEIEKDLFEINSDIGAITRALGGRQMSDNKA